MVNFHIFSELKFSISDICLINFLKKSNILTHWEVLTHFTHFDTGENIIRKIFSLNFNNISHSLTNIFDKKSTIGNVVHICGIGGLEKLW